MVSTQLALALNDTNRYRNQWLYILDGGKDWLVVTPGGFFDGSPGTWRFVAYRDVATRKLVDDDAADVNTVVPFVSRSVTVRFGTVFPVTCTVTCWDAVPLKVSLPFWPGALVVTPTELPPIVTVPVVSAGTSYAAIITLPVLIRFAGADGYGAYSQVNTIVGFLVPFAAFGLAGSIVRFFSAESWTQRVRG